MSSQAPTSNCEEYQNELKNHASSSQTKEGRHGTNPSWTNSSVRLHPTVVSIKKVIFPENKWIKRWDTLVLFLLLALAFILPYQIGVSAGKLLIKSNAWLGFTIAMNGVFFVDTFLYFRRAYRDQDGRLIFNLSRIRKRYLRTYFFPNLISLAPSTLIFTIYGRRIVNDKQNDSNLSDDDYNTSLLITIRMIDLLKLIRFTRVSSIFYASDVIREFREKRKAYVLELMKYSFLVIIVSHIFACFWSFIAFCEVQSFGTDMLTTPNWITYWFENNEADGGINPLGWNNDLDRYVLSLFWAIQTITSIGYGNVAPLTAVEWWFGCILQLLAGVLWAYIIGGLVGVAAATKMRDEIFNTRMDQTNDMVKMFDSSGQYPDIGDERSVAKRIRRYINDQKERTQNMYSYANTLGAAFPVLETLPPELRRISSLFAMQQYLEAVPYLSSQFLSCEEQSLVAAQCMFLVLEAGERHKIEDGVNGLGRGIFVLNQGCAFANKSGGHVNKESDLYTRGKAFGIERVLLEDGHDGARGRLDFITFSKAVFIPRTAIMSALDRNPEAWRACARWKYMKALLKYEAFRMRK